MPDVFKVEQSKDRRKNRGSQGKQERPGSCRALKTIIKTVASITSDMRNNERVLSKQ